ncbi:MAG TPA: alpha-1,3/4-fucosidase [Porphyromonadaceae bacterium]|jgi:alpha-L-fucosidase|nr:alpha-1,3/4-fucosidase [Porphyromonadaceae bacterium]HBX21242.1 alpha-1,3/4-fucosidase [Porphyromonadaceae bacterium]
MRQILIVASLLAAIVLFDGCRQKERAYFEKEIIFPEEITPEQKIKLSAYLTPTPQQYAWQQLELTAFIHFGMNTFTGREWGDGTEDPSVFQPTDFNAEQWVSVLQKAGFNMLILTAKHHDGFCLWPTKTTAHSVASSPWRGGQGDIVREVKNACDKYNMKFGVYLSPWDRNARSYGDSPAYNHLFIQQLTELLTQYGRIDEVWFDGANAEGPNGKRQIYDWKRFYQVIDSLQPQSVKAIMGNDIRWVGNESGLGRQTEWSVTPLQPDINESIVEENKRLGVSPMSEDLGSRKLIGEAKALYWYPSEVDVSIRPGWFYHPEEDHQVKTLAQLVDIYYQSVGLNSVLLLNIPPDTRGQLHEIDSRRLIEFGDYLSYVFKNDKLSDGHNAWRAKPGDFKEFDMKDGDPINTILLQEDILKGQRVEVFKVEGLIGSEWIKLGEGTTIGYKRLIKFDDCTPSKIRVTILETREKAAMKRVGAYFAPAIDDSFNSMPISNNPSGWKVIANDPLTLDMSKTMVIEGFTYTPDPQKESVFAYTVEISNDGKNWKEVRNNEFANIKNNPIKQRVMFKQQVKTRFIRFQSLVGIDGGNAPFAPTQIKILTK